MNDNQRFIQVLAAVVMLYGSICVAAADKYNWRDLANVGNTVVGVGAGLITGQKLAQVTNKDNATLNVASEGN